MQRVLVVLGLLVGGCATKRLEAEHRDVMTALENQRQQLAALQGTLSAIESEQMQLRARQGDLITAMSERSDREGGDPEDLGFRAEIRDRLDAIDRRIADAPPSPGPRLGAGRPDPAAVYRMPIDGASSRGSASAKVTIVACSDFQCPFCARARPTLDELATIYGDNLRIVFKHNPLPMHKHALDAAKAAEAAGKQDKFWPMHDRLFENGKTMSSESFNTWAGELGLDVAKFERDMNDPEIAARIFKQQKSCVDLGARGTPSFFINGRYLSGAQPVDAFRTLIDEEMAKAKALLKKGVKPKKLYDAIIAKGRTAP